MANNFDAGQNGDMPWDLRTIYANFIVAPDLVECREARVNRDFQRYWQCLNNLYVIIAHKIKEKTKEGEKDEYKTLRDKAINVLNANIAIFQGQDHNPKGMEEVLNALQDIEMFFYRKMEEAKMFGGQKVQDKFM